MSDREKEQLEKLLYKWQQELKSTPGIVASDKENKVGSLLKRLREERNYESFVA